jgi:hypothetical protein
MKLRQAIPLALLAFVPISVAAEQLHWGDGAVLITAVLAILPLAVWLSTATEELALALGPSIGALLNALFGNATELIIAITALRAGLVEIVKASITGTVMANLLLALGLSMLVGGIGRREHVAVVPALLQRPGHLRTGLLDPPAGGVSRGGLAVVHRQRLRQAIEEPDAAEGVLSRGKPKMGDIGLSDPLKRAPHTQGTHLRTLVLAVA